MRASTEVREIVRHAIATAPDPNPIAIAPRVVAQLKNTHIDALIMSCIQELVRAELHHFRRPPRQEGVSWRSRARQEVDRLNLDGLGIAISVGGDMKWVEECTADDLLAYAEEQHKRGTDLLDAAAEAKRVGLAVRASGAGSVDEWGWVGG